MSYLKKKPLPEPQPKKRTTHILRDEPFEIQPVIPATLPVQRSQDQGADNSLDHLKFIYRSIMLKTSHCSKAQMLREIRAKLEEFE